jgi:hypothetical protein
MRIELSRLRAGEIAAGVSGLLLAVFMFALPWYGLKRALAPTASSLGISTSFDGWHALSHVRWLVLLTVIAALALAYFQAASRAPAIPVTISVIATVLGAITVLALIYRVLINVPGPANLVDVKPGAYLGLVTAIGVLVGAFVSMREEGISPRDAPAEIETVRAGAPAGS